MGNYTESQKESIFVNGKKLLLTMVVIFIFWCLISYSLFSNLSVWKLGNENIEWFPLIAYCNNKVVRIEYKDIHQFLIEKPNTTFLIPKEKEQTLSDELTISFNKETIFTTFQIKVKENKGDSQIIEFDIYGKNHDETVVYEAFDKKIKPISYSVFGPFHIIIFLGIILVGNIFSFIILFVGYKVFKLTFLRKLLH